MNYFPNNVILGLLEVPGEICLIIPFAGCGHSCKGCHSPLYRDSDRGILFTEEVAQSLLTKYKDKISCVVFFNREPEDWVLQLFSDFKLALFIGDETFSNYQKYDYVKIGPYQAIAGGLESPTTNQRLFKVKPKMQDITYLYQRSLM